MERAANIAFTFFVVVEVALAFVAVKSGLLQTRLHWLVRAGGTLIVGSGLSCLIVGLSFLVRRRHLRHPNRERHSARLRRSEGSSRRECTV